MIVYPAIIGGWGHVHAVWYTWQSLNAGVLAFAASVVALNAVKYAEEKKRQRSFVAARAFLPQALSELCNYFDKCALLNIEAWLRAKDKSDLCESPLSSELPCMPKRYEAVFKDCISEAQPHVGEHLAYILMRLQIHHSRMVSMCAEFSEDSDYVTVHVNIMNQVFGLAELQCLVNQLFDYARGIGDFDGRPLEAESFFSTYRVWNIDLEGHPDLVGFTERNHAKRWNTHSK